MFDLTPSFYSIKAFNDVTPLVRLWSLRALVLAGGYRKFALTDRFSDADVADALGFEPGSAEGKYSRAAVLQQLQDMQEAAERAAAACVPPEILRRNLACLADLMGLNELECRILCLVTYILRDRFLQTVTDMLGDLTFNQIFDSLAAMLAVPANDIRTALAPKATLVRSGTVQLDPGCVSLMRSRLDVLSDSLVDAIHCFELDTGALIRGVASRCHAPVLTLKDYTSVRDVVEMIQLLLESRVAERSAGTNILVYGTPGTGKSQLVRVIAQQLDLPLFEVASQNAAGNSVDGERRLRALSAAQCILNRQPALLLFDELEDAFRSPDLGAAARGLGQKCKAWMNNMLETNPVPTFWVSNSVDCLDPAFIRRFDIVLELGNPSAEQTELLIRDVCADMVSAGTARRIASHTSVSPAMITRAAAVVSKLGTSMSAERIEGTLESLINATLRAQGRDPIASAPVVKPHEEYDPRYINAEFDIEQVASGLMQHRDARLLLWGAPGTGKSAFGKWLSDQLDMPLHVKRGSDLLDKLVGGTEHNLSEAFASARRDGAVLMIDEVDSFMLDRRNANHTWEVTQVNEMLTQLEAFDGIFIATTNLLGNIDPASLRRFDLVAGFDWMKPEQVGEMLVFLCQQLGLPQPDTAHLATVRALCNLAPGDFAAIRRQSRFRPVASVAKLVQELQRISVAKGGAVHKPIGFLPER